MTVSSGPGESCRHDSISLTNVRQTFNKACYHRCRPRWHNGKEHAYQCRRHKRRVFHSWVGKIPWRRKWQPIPAFLPGDSHGQRSLVGYSPRGRIESDTTERLRTAQHRGSYGAEGDQESLQWGLQMPAGEATGKLFPLPEPQHPHFIYLFGCTRS